jgi:1,4-alpha-glucan branching enzyme
MIAIPFVYATGIKREIFRNLRLIGSWDASGRFSKQWSVAAPMDLTVLEDGCPGYTATVQFDDSEAAKTFCWGVRLDAPRQPDIWGIPTEVQDRFSQDRSRSFVLTPQAGEQRYYFTHCRRLGAQKLIGKDSGSSGIHFGVWAPNAAKVEVVFGKFDPALGTNNTGYISDDGAGIDTTVGEHGAFPMIKGSDGMWYTAPGAPFDSFTPWDHKPYMFRVTKDDGQVAYRTDLYSRCQIGKGGTDPKLPPYNGSYNGSYKDLDGTKSCSVVIDPEKATVEFEEGVFPEIAFETSDSFWANEFDLSRPLPRRMEDLIIYELHVGSLGFGTSRDGNFGDILGIGGAPNFLDYLADLGVNTVELMPVLQFEGTDHWGYGNSHPYALEFSAGGRDQLKHVIRECHRRGLAVILDVVFNHYHVDSERAEWGYDSSQPQKNLYYWYEGQPSDYPAYEEAARRDPQKNPPGQGGYLDNFSTGYGPRFWEESLRKWFIGSTVALAEEFHVDGFRVDLPQALYQFNVRHGDGISVPDANAFGAKFLREFTRTVKMVRPECLLIAEDHSGNPFVTESVDAGGLGFDATWYSAFYHHLIGDGNYGSDYARLLYVAGLGDDRPLAMDYFAGALSASGQRKVVYHEDHDDAGNAENTARTMVSAVNGAPLVGATRAYAEARCRCVCGLSMLSAGTPMFLMGEELATAQPLPFHDFRPFRDNFPEERAHNGAYMFKFYQDLIRLRRNRPGLRSHLVDVIHIHNANRVIAFLRYDGVERYLVVASLNNQPFQAGYWIGSQDLNGAWREVFNSDSATYAGNNVGNSGGVLIGQESGLKVVIPANGFVVFEQVQAR